MAMNFLLTLLALLPLVVIPPIMYPYTSGKTLLIRSIVTLVAVLFSGRLMIQPTFRRHIAERLSLIKKSRIFWATCVYVLTFVVSAVLATDRFSAFFGTFQRQEGMIGMLFFFGFFLFAILLFKRAEWLWFFRLTLLSAVVLFVDAVVQKVGGDPRPVAFIGNAIFLSAYFLFAVFSAAIVYVGSSERPWKWIAASVGVLSFLGVFLANSRGVIIGLFVGAVVALVYALARPGKQKTPFARFAPAGALAIAGLFAGIFLLTSQSLFWQSIPGLDRLAQISSQDASTEARFYSISLTLRMMNPADNGIKTFLFGWGPENYLLASTKYFDPLRYPAQDSVATDRAHDKLLDVFATNGIFGLLAYLAIWIFILRAILIAPLQTFTKERTGQIALRSVLLFYAVAYAVQNLSAFDSLTSFVTFFAFLGFLVFLEV